MLLMECGHIEEDFKELKAALIIVIFHFSFSVSVAMSLKSYSIQNI